MNRLASHSVQFTTNPLRTDVDSNPGRIIGKLITNLLTMSCGTAHYGINLLFFLFFAYILSILFTFHTIPSERDHISYPQQIHHNTW
jgi:hypothetical protein